MSGIEGKKKFVLVNKAEYPKLKYLLNSRLPESVALHNAVQLALTGTSEIEFYTYPAGIDDQALIAGVCYIKDKEEDPGFLWPYLSTANPKNITDESAKAFIAFLQPESQPAWRPMMLGSVHEMTPTIVKALLDRGATVKAIPSQGFCYPATKLENSMGEHYNEAPAGLVVKALEPQHAALVASSWNYGLLTAGGTEATIRSYILHNPSAAVFSADVPDEPLSWATCYDFGKVAMLFTPEKYRGRGYASLIMKRMVAEMARRGLVPAASVSVRNLASLAAMAKAGYEKTYLVEFIFAE